MKNRSIRALASALILGPAVLSALVGVGSVIAFAPRLPDLIAVHWGIDGTVDRTDSLASVVLTSALFAPLLALTIVLVFAAMTRQTVATAFARVLVGVGVFVGVFIGLLPLAFLAPQLDVSDALAVPVSAVALPLGLIFAVAAAMGGGLSFVIPRVHSTTTTATSAPALDIAAGERAYWGRTVWPKAPVFAIFFGALLVSTTALVVAGATWWIVVVVAVVFGLLATTLAWHVVVDIRGVRVIAALGFPRITLPIAEITGARAVSIDPLREFGGWGVRFAASGAWGVIVKKGNALEVSRDGKAPFVVTIDDAETAARLVSGLAKATTRTDS